MALSREELRDHPPLVMGSRFNSNTTESTESESDEAADTAGAGSGSTPTESSDSDTNATTTTTTTPMSNDNDDDLPDDNEMIDTLVDEHGLDRENMEPLEGEDCLGDIYRRFNAESGTEPESGGGDGEATDSPETTEIPDAPDEPGGEETADETPEDGEGLTFESEEAFNEAVADAMAERENAQKQESLIEWIDSRSERYNAEMLEGTPEGVLAEIADDVADEQRENATTDTESWSDSPPQADRGAMQTDGPLRANAGEDAPEVAVGDDPFGTTESEEADD